MLDKSFQFVKISCTFTSGLRFKTSVLYVSGYVKPFFGFVLNHACLNVFWIDSKLPYISTLHQNFICSRCKSKRLLRTATELTTNALGNREGAMKTLRALTGRLIIIPGIK